MPPVPGLFAAIVCKDSEPTIGRTLDSLAPLCEKVLALDSGSTDRTIPMLQSAGAIVERVQWMGHVKTKQTALERAGALGARFILSVDSDESVEPALDASIREVLARPSPPRVMSLNRRTFYRGRPLRYTWQPEWRVRLVAPGTAAWAGFDPHDSLRPLNSAEPVHRLAGDLRHHSFPTFQEHMRKQWHHATTMAKSLHDSGVRGSYLRLVVSPAGAMLKQLVLKRGVLDGPPGWMAAASTAVAALIKHATIIELDHMKRESR